MNVNASVPVNAQLRIVKNVFVIATALQKLRKKFKLLMEKLNIAVNALANVKQCAPQVLYKLY